MRMLPPDIYDIAPYEGAYEYYDLPQDKLRVSYYYNFIFLRNWPLFVEDESSYNFMDY